MAAMLSYTIKVRDYQVYDVVLYPISISWKPTSEEMTDGDNSSLVFEKGCMFPSKKYVRFCRSDDFEICAYYSDISLLPPATVPSIGKFHIKVPKSTEPKEIKVKVVMDVHGLFSIESAQLIEEIEEMEVEPPKTTPAKDAIPKETPQTPETKADNQPEPKPDQKMETQETSPSDKPAPTTDKPAPAGDKSAPTTDKPAPVEKGKKIKVKKTDLVVVATYTNGMTTEQLRAANEHEAQMALQDRIAFETAEKKNALETYGNQLTEKIYKEWADYATDKERDTAVKMAQAANDWLYSSEGEDTTKSAYSNKLEELMKLGEPIKVRLNEERERANAVQVLKSTISEFQQFVESTDPKYEHIEKVDRDKIADELKSAFMWLDELSKKQNSTPKNINPVLLVKDLKLKREKLENFVKPIMNRPKPKPKPEEKKEEKKQEPQAPPQASASEQAPVPEKPAQPPVTDKKDTEPEIMQTD